MEVFLQLPGVRKVYSFMNEKPRKHNRKALFLGAAAAATLTGLGWVWAEDAAPATPPALAAQDGPGPKGGPDKACQGGKGDRPGPRGDHWKGRDHRGGMDRREHGPGGPHGLLSELNLTAEQKEKVKAIMVAQKPKIEAIRQEEHAKVKAVFDEAETQIRPILTKEQQQVLDDAKKLEASKAALKKDQPPKPE